VSAKEEAIVTPDTAGPATGALAAVLWDMDGTLIDSEPTWIESQIRLVGEFGGAWNHADGLTLVGTDMVVTAEALQRAGVRLDADEIIQRLTREVTDALGREVTWRPGAVDLVTALRDAGVPQAIVTTSPRSMARVVADALPAGAIRAIVAGEDVAAGKPDPEPYLTAARTLGVRPEDCVALEDSPTGLAAAIAAGTHAIGIPHDAVLANAGAWTRLETLRGVPVDRLVQLVGGPRVDPAPFRCVGGRDPGVAAP
jgi:HAD superfamily hydrolase (TIGR01509 family)